MTIAASQAQPGDILLDAEGTAWQRGPEFYNWSTFTGRVGYYGPWSDSYGPQGELVLLARAGKPAPPGLYACPAHRSLRPGHPTPSPVTNRQRPFFPQETRHDHARPGHPDPVDRR